MTNEIADTPIASPAVPSSLREFQHLWARRAAALDTIHRTGDLHVPQIASFDARCKLVGLLRPVASDVSGDHAAANIVIYVPDNGRDSATGGDSAS